MRLLQDIGHGIHAYLIVGGVYAHGLIYHGRLVGIPQKLIVIREGYDLGADSYNQEGIDLVVCVRGGLDMTMMIIYYHLMKRNEKAAGANTRTI